jgi:PAS domain S-box-containing protein
MPIPLRVLIVEDSPDDAEMMVLHLKDEGFQPEWQCVQTEVDYLSVLETNPELILADWSLPQFSGLRALQLMNARGLDIPFIIISGNIGEEAAVEAMRQGVADYLLKDRLARLGQAVHRALDDKQQREENRQADKDLRESQARLQHILNVSPTVIYTITPDFVALWVSENVETVLGYTVDESLVPGWWADHLHPDDRPRIFAEMPRILEIKEYSHEYRFQVKDGSYRWIFDEMRLIRDAQGNPAEIVGTWHDITERKQMEKKLEEERTLLGTLIDNLPDRIYAMDVQGRKIISNVADWQASGGKKREDIIGKTDFDTYPSELAEKYWSLDKAVIDSGKSIINYEEPGLDSQGHPVWVLSSKVPLLDGQGKVVGLVGIGRDISEIKLAEEKIHRQLNRLAALREVDSAITSSTTSEPALNMILAQIASQLGIDAANILLLDPHTHTLAYFAGRGFRTEALQHTRLQLGEGYAGRAALERKIVQIPDLRGRKTDLLRSPEFSKEGFVCYFGVPLLAEGKVQGVLEVFQRSALNPGKDWLDFLQTLAGQAAIAIYNKQLFEGLQRSNLELQLAYDATIEGWSQAMDLRDKETEGHSLRVTELTIRLARGIGMSEDEIVHVRRGALLHDIGKLSVPDAILLKPGELTDEEWALMKKHPQLAYDMLLPIAYLHPALDIPYCHHEKWDGTGYPRGLKGQEIPLSARIFAIVDVWDALTSARPYRAAWPRQKVIDYLWQQSGAFFDPAVVKAFFASF